MALTDYNRDAKSYFRIYMESGEHFVRMKYDFFGSVRFPLDTAWNNLKKGEKSIFEALADKYTVRQFVGIALANNMYGFRKFPFDPPKAIRNYNLFYKRRQSLSEMIRGDMHKLFADDSVDIRNDWIRIVDYERANIISFETLVTINHIIPIAKYLIDVSKCDTMSFLVKGYKPLAIRILKSERMVNPSEEILLGVRKILENGESPVQVFP